MNIGINLLYLLPKIVGGTETYARGLLHGLSKINQTDEFFIFTNEETANWELPYVNNFHRIHCAVNAVNRIKRYIFEQVRLPGLLRHYKIDIVHSLGYVAPLYPPCKSIVSIPDLNYLAFGEEMPLVRRSALGYFVKKSAHRSSGIIAISEFGKREIAGKLGVHQDKIRVIHLASKFGYSGTYSDYSETDTIFRSFEKPYLVAFSGSSKNKNIGRLIEAFSIIKNEMHFEGTLILIGRPPEDPEIFKMIKQFGLGDYVTFTYYIDDAAVKKILQKAILCVFPSFYEGFGLPILEAMESGIPVVCSNTSALPEVAGDAAVYFDPYNVRDIAERVASLLNDENIRAVLREKGSNNFKKFSWEDTAVKTLDFYRYLAQNK